MLVASSVAVPDTVGARAHILVAPGLRQTSFCALVLLVLVFTTCFAVAGVACDRAGRPIAQGGDVAAAAPRASGAIPWRGRVGARLPCAQPTPTESSRGEREPFRVGLKLICGWW